MKHYIFRSENARSLHVIFAGWGMDEQIFTPMANNQEDLLICYDYTEMSFDTDLLNGYETIRLTAWSMGVWAAATTFGNQNIPFVKRTAINGTHTPVDDHRGIPVAIFEGTLHTLNERNLERFIRRMCNSDKDLISDFYAHHPKRDLESLREELNAIGSLAKAQTPVFHWDEVILGEQDLIFPFENQKNAWMDNGSTKSMPIAHYADFGSILKQL
ncbi:MAG: pimeloyl-ACP methyl esterase BioG family protein [Bacteroidales bacterium]